MTDSVKRVAVLGGTGQLGSDVVEVLSRSPSYRLTPFSHEQLDVTDHAKVMEALALGFDVVVNCAAFTRVDDCEEQPGKALLVNARGALEVARACAQTDSLCVHVSTDYVFSGDKGSPYAEDDPAGPVNMYGASKLAGEYFVKQVAKRWLILRIASVFGKRGSRGKGGNFVETVLSKAYSGTPVRVVHDTWMSPTYTMDVAHALGGLIQIGATGLYHASNSGRCSWFEFAREATRLLSLDTEIEPISSSSYPTRARRPRDSSLDNSHLKEVLCHSIRPWPEALKAYLVEKGQLQS
jgi:dTDP-4-dehydrorhamnose reductase